MLIAIKADAIKVNARYWFDMIQNRKSKVPSLGKQFCNSSECCNWGLVTLWKWCSPRIPFPKLLSGKQRDDMCHFASFCCDPIGIPSPYVANTTRINKSMLPTKKSPLCILHSMWNAIIFNSISFAMPRSETGSSSVIKVATLKRGLIRIIFPIICIAVTCCAELYLESIGSFFIKWMGKGGIAFRTCRNCESNRRGETLKLPKSIGFQRVPPLRYFTQTSYPFSSRQKLEISLTLFSWVFKSFISCSCFFSKSSSRVIHVSANSFICCFKSPRSLLNMFRLKWLTFPDSHWTLHCIISGSKVKQRSMVEATSFWIIAKGHGSEK